MTPPDMLMGVVPNSGGGGRLGDDLGAQGSGLRARQTKGGPHAPESAQRHSDSNSKPHSRQ